MRVIQREHHSSDGALMASFFQGDRAAFGVLVERHQAAVLGVVRRYAANAEDAADLAQRAFLRALEAAGRVRMRASPDELPFRKWVIRIALNLAKNQLRDAKRRQMVLPAPPLAPVPLDEAAERRELSRRARFAVLQLPRRQREVFGLRIDAELSFAEIAATLGITENAAKVNLHHAIARLRALTKEEER